MGKGRGGEGKGRGKGGKGVGQGRERGRVRELNHMRVSGAYTSVSEVTRMTSCAVTCRKTSVKMVLIFCSLSRARLLHRQTDGWSDGQADGQTDRQTNRQTGRQTDK